MAITFTNNLKENILDPLKAIISAEFAQAVYFDNEFVDRGTNWFNLQPVSDTLLEDLAAAHTRSFEVVIQYYRAVSGEFKKDTHIDAVSAITERLKRLIRNNRAYSTNWINGRLDSINYNVEAEDLSPDIVLVEATFNAEVLEVI
ncbi:MAG: hypothetical protein CMC15_16315 [Flavobacteriaceae bacterium]|nr:hypothetical protein [Flavobacteriaceae bacterium]|tara:strand:- start:286 stop:720 length:435 start_codon:yes stop_codon:yes gene_type:complete